MRGLAHHQQIAAADAFLGDADRGFDQELAVHHRNSPEATITQFLGLLETVAEIANRTADAHSFLFRTVLDSVVTGRRGAGQNALPHSSGQ